MGTVLFEMQLLNILLLLFSSVCLASASETQAKKARDPKLFYVSTTTTTSTWFGSTICFASTTTSLGTCGKRKRRSISLSDFDPDYTPKIEPSALSDEDNLEDAALVEPPSLWPPSHALPAALHFHSARLYFPNCIFPC